MVALLVLLRDVKPPADRHYDTQHDERAERDHEHQRALVGVQLPEVGEDDERGRQDLEEGHVAAILADRARAGARGLDVANWFL